MLNQLKYRFVNRELSSPFYVTFPDGATRPAALLVSLSKQLDHWFRATKLADMGLVESSDFFIAANPVAQDVSMIPSTMGQKEYQRTVLSIPGVIKLMSREKSEFSDALADLITSIIVPKALGRGIIPKRQPALQDFRNLMNSMTKDIRREASSLGLSETMIRRDIWSQLMLGLIEQYILTERAILRKRSQK